MYNTADSLIVGNFLGSNALAAVSSSGNLIFLMVGFINGIAMGAGVVVARYYGAKIKDCLQKAIHTTVAFGLVAGVVLTVMGMFLAPKILVLMGTPADVLSESIVYFRTYFAGSIGVVMYNIFVGILQSVGDSHHPLIYLIISSCINVVLDIFFIAGLGMGVAFRLLSTPHGMPYSKVIIVVDEFVDPFNLEQVMWALTTRVKPSKDVAIIPNCAGMPLDPSSVPAGMHDKLIIDATTPVAPEPNPRSVELLKPSPATPKWEAIFRDFMAAQKNQ